jgi:protein O-mannosyl-transferase
LRQAALIPVAVIAVAITAAYWVSLPAPFHFDDYGAIVEDQSIRRVWPFGGELPAVAQTSGRPLVKLSYALNFPFTGLDPSGYRGVNVAIHILNALLLYGIVRRTFASMTGDPSAQNAVHAPLRGAHLPALAVALIWALHPIQTGTVTYVSARSEALMALWFLAALYASIRAQSRRPLGWTITAIACCALGMVSKETMVVAPLVVVLYDRAFLYSSFREALAVRWGLYAGLASTLAVAGALAWSAPYAEWAGLGVGVSTWVYLLNQAVIVTDYLRTAVWPTSLVFTYGEPRPLQLTAVIPQAVFVVSLLAAAVWAWIRAPRAGFAALWFFIVLAPTSSFISIATEAGAERRMYMPLAGLVALGVAGVGALWTRLPSLSSAHVRRKPDTMKPVAGPVAAAIVCAGLMAATISRNADYLSAETLWRSTLESWPSGMGHRNLATALRIAGKRTEAVEHFRQAATGHPEVRSLLGRELYELGRHAEAVPELRQFLATNPPDTAEVRDSRFLLGRALMATGRTGEAVPLFNQILAQRPADTDARLGLADALLDQRRFADAAAAYRIVVETRSQDVGVLSNFGIALFSAGAPREAAAIFRQAATLEPRNANIRRNLAVALAGLGELTEAREQAVVWLALEPANPSARELYSELSNP